MRCRLGDLVMVVNDLDYKENVGRLGVIVSRPVSPPGHWWVEPAGKFWGQTIDGVDIEDADWVRFNDCELRPIRDNPGADETLEWATHPGLLTDLERA